MFTCKLCAWDIFITLLTRLLCDNSNSLTYQIRKGAKSNTFTCQLCDCTGAIHSTKISGNFGAKLNGSVKSFEKTGPHFEVDHFSRSDRSECWLNGSHPTSHADWLFKVIIVTWTDEDLFSFVTNTLSKGSCLLSPGGGGGGKGTPHMKGWGCSLEILN